MKLVCLLHETQKIDAQLHQNSPMHSICPTALSPSAILNHTRSNLAAGSTNSIFDD